MDHLHVAILTCVLLSCSYACADRRELLLTPGHPDKYIVCKTRKCLAFSECITAPDQCFKSNTTVLLLPVQYNLTAPVVIKDVQQLSLCSDNKYKAHCGGYWNESLGESWLGTDLSENEFASNGSENSPDHGGSPKATIRCSGEAGFLFINATFLSIADIHFVSCGFEINTTQLVAQTHYPQIFLNNSYTAGLQLMLTFHTVINRVHFSNSTGNALFWINPFGSYLVNSIVNSTNYYRMKEQLDGTIDCTKLSSRCMGGNVWILFVDTECPSLTTATKFVIQNTKILYGINLYNLVWGPRYAGGLGVSLTQTSFDVQVHIRDCNIHHNVADAGANAYFRIMYFVSNSSIHVFNSSLSYGNRPFTDPEFMGYYDQAPGAYIDIDSLNVIKTGGMNICINHTDTIDTRVVFDGVWMIDNRGGAMKIFITEAGQPCCFDVLVTNTVINGTQVYYYDADVRVSIALLIQEERAETNPSLTVSLSHVQISNSYIEYGAKGKAELKNFPKITTLLFSETSSVHIHNSVIESNNATGILALSSSFNFSGNNTMRYNNGILGGALSMDGNSIMFLQPDSRLVLSENVAEYGGGIVINDGIVKQYPGLCFFQLVPKVQSNILSSGAQVILENNIANQAGHSLYGGNYGPHGQAPVCNQLYQNLIHPSRRKSEWEVFNATFQIRGAKRDSDLSSAALGPCFCAKQKCNVSIHSVNQLLYPGQHFSVAATGLGYFHGTTNANIIPSLLNLSTNEKFGPTVIINNNSQQVGTTCGDLSFKLTAPESATNIGIRLVAEGSSFPYGFSKVVNVTTKCCPVGFQLLNHRCACLPVLRKLHVECNIDDQSFSRIGPVWVSVTDHKVLYHKNCPPEYCYLPLVHFHANKSDAQCADNHSGVLCGECKEGFSIALGTSKCLQCTNAYLGLIVVFFLAGILLIVFLAVLNMTVATGTINGLIFYANIVQAGQGSFGVAPYGNKIASVFIAWLNLDLGIQMCFYNGLNIFAKTLLQFAFPVYIWVMVTCIIVSSHYFSFMGRLSGPNIVPVLATLFLLSYTKILRAVIVAFSFTLIYQDDSTSYTVWLYNGNLQFLHGKHLILFVCSIVFALLFILPLLLLTLFAPCLQRARYPAIQILTIKLKPLLDAYQGPYKDRYRFWTGLMLLVQTLLLIGFAMNESGDPAIVLLVVILVGSLILVVSLVRHGGMYKRVLFTGFQCFHVYNLVLFASWSLYNRYTYGEETELFHQQRLAVDMTTGMTALAFVITVVYHICSRRRVKEWISQTLRRTLDDIMGSQEDEESAAAVFTAETESTPLIPPTFSVVSIHRTNTRSRTTH